MAVAGWVVAVVLLGVLAQRPGLKRFEVHSNGMMKFDTVTGQAWILTSAGSSRDYWRSVSGNFTEILEAAARAIENNPERNTFGDVVVTSHPGQK